MSTTAETPVEPDRRKRPGEGKRRPRHHTVRIVVLRDKALTEARRSRASNGGHHGLTAEELEIGEALLKKMPAPSTSNRRSKTKSSMFEELEITDIVVIGTETASVRLADEEGHPVSRSVANAHRAKHLSVHDHSPNDTVLRVWTESDTIEYKCDEPFEIVRVNRAGWKVYGAPEDPFGNSKNGYKARAEGNGKSLWVWTSGLLPATANNQQYKMTFAIFDEKRKEWVEVDPDIVCGDPPPVPGP